jgi:hypothetical protein
VDRARHPRGRAGRSPAASPRRRVRPRVARAGRDDDRAGERVRRATPPVLLVSILLAFASSIEPVLLTLGALGALGVVAAAGVLTPPPPPGGRAARRAARDRRLAGGDQPLRRRPADPLGWPAHHALLHDRRAAPRVPDRHPRRARAALDPAGRPLGLHRYIEFFRGSPLITLLFVGWLILPFFLPPDFPTPGLVTRALVIFVLFTSAYVAEIVRGGLQAVGRGQRRGGAGARAEPVEADAPGRAPPGAPGGHPRPRRTGDQPLQGHDARAHHRPVRPARRRPR